MIFDQYIKLFNTDWIEPWMVEALAIIVGSLLLVFVICKALDCFNGDNQ
jgi:hypothetical protein